MNIMTLGGLALAVGILVDDATVEIENIDRNLELGKDVTTAILDGAQQIALPALVSTLCICIVFVPMFFLAGVARFLFVPLAEAVVFAMLASYVLSRTLVPTLVQYILRGHEHEDPHAPRGFFGRFQAGFERGFERMRGAYLGLLERCLALRWVFLLPFLGVCLASTVLLLTIGQDFFPTVDAGQFKLHMRARTATRIEETAATADRVEQYIRTVIPKDELTGILDNIGLPYSGMNTSYSNNGTIGTADVEILCSLDAEKHGPTANYIAKLREELPKRFPGDEFFFQPADIVSQILNFGLSAPIDVQFIGKRRGGQPRRRPGRSPKRSAACPGRGGLAHLPTLQPTQDRRDGGSFQGQPARPDPARRGQQHVGVRVEQQLPGLVRRFFLNNKNQHRQLQPRGAPPRSTASRPSAGSPGPAHHQRQRRSPTSSSSTSPRFERVRPARPSIRTTLQPQAPVVDILCSVQGRDLGAVSSDINRIINGYSPTLPWYKSMLPFQDWIVAHVHGCKDLFKLPPSKLPRGSLIVIRVDRCKRCGRRSQRSRDSD